MKLASSLPTSAPEPAAVPEGKRDPKDFPADSLQRRMYRQLKINWENCKPKFWQWTPNHVYRFRAAQLDGMEKLLTDEERIDIPVRYDRKQSLFSVANAVGVPYFLVKRVVARESRLREGREAEAFGNESGPLLRLQNLQAKIMAEMESRLATTEKRKAIDNTELSRMLGRVSAVVQRMEESKTGGGEVSMTVVSKIPDEA